jgi:soluble lytic murein transglycosylase
VQADWVLGLASWRAGDMEAAAEAFSAVSSRARDPELMAAGLYWAARSDTAGGHPERIEARLRTAARLGETFYGMLATGILGVADPQAVTFQTSPDMTQPVQMPYARVATALVEIGEKSLADQWLRHQARIGDPAAHAGLIALAARLDLPATQVWLAQNGPSGLTTTIANRYPMPNWAPAGGWRVDRALCLAHALQESQLHVDAVSRAGARGLMQLMPGTARLVARHKGGSELVADHLDDPAVSFEYGQSYLEELAGNAATGGQLLKVIAAYNAGPNNVAAWAARPGASQDPLFFIETIPFAETRTYVATVMRNYWMYQHATGAATESLAALTEGRWPRFPANRASTRVAYDAVAAAGTSGN